jgi:tetratricopeptide (TPR) repeat protein
MTVSLNELDRAWALLGQQRFAEAERQAEAVLHRFPDNVSALACHAMAHWKAGGDIAVSLIEMRRAVALAPDVASIRHNFATLLASRGDVDAASAEFREALRIKPDDTMAFYGLSQNHKFRDGEGLIEAMVALDADPRLEPARREFLDYGLAKAFDDLNLPDKAMAYATEANRLGARPWDLAGEAAALEELGELARLDAFRRTRDSGHPSRAPVFIVGMPRSGTTLVEAILARHPEVVALGESSQLPEIEQAAFAQFKPGLRPPVGRQDLAVGLGRDWLAARAETVMKQATAGARRAVSVVTDKLPENAVRLGLVARLFPHARIVHVRRHPLDTGVSNFFQRFSHGQGFSTRLDWTGMRIRQIADSMAIWKRALDLPVLDLSYEQLVANPEAQSRRLVAFAGLDWTDACLEPQSLERSVLTASQWQVRQPINQGSVARWRRYERWLGPMIEAMGGFAWIDAEVAASSGEGR